MSNLCQNLIDTVDNCEFNDVIIKLEDGEIFVNKFILSVRTNYFSSILYTSLDQNNSFRYMFFNI